MTTIADAVEMLKRSDQPVYKRNCVLKYLIDDRVVSVTIPALTRQLQGMGVENAQTIARALVKMPCRRPFPLLPALGFAKAA